MQGRLVEVREAPEIEHDLLDAPEPVARARVQALAQLIACEIHPLNNLRVLNYLRGELKLDAAAVNKWYSHWIAEAFAPLETLVWRFDSVPEAVETFTATLGPLVKARELLEPQGRWHALHRDITDWFERGNRTTTGAVELPMEYLVVLGHKHA